MAATALGLYLFYLLTAFGLRSLLHYRRTGSTGFKGLSGRPGSAEWSGGALFVLALLLGLAAPALQLAGALAPVAVLDAAAVHLAGLVLAAAGIVGTLAAQSGMGNSWRIGVDPAETTTLVTTGTFALARNPIFTAMITAAGGLTLLAPNLVALAALLALVAAIQLQVRVVEEPYLLRQHGQPYRDYARTTGRFLPYSDASPRPPPVHRRRARRGPGAGRGWPATGVTPAAASWWPHAGGRRRGQLLTSEVVCHGCQ